MVFLATILRTVLGGAGRLFFGLPVWARWGLGIIAGITAWFKGPEIVKWALEGIGNKLQQLFNILWSWFGNFWLWFHMLEPWQQILLLTLIVWFFVRLFIGNEGEGFFGRIAGAFAAMAHDLSHFMNVVKPAWTGAIIYCFVMVGIVRSPLAPDKLQKPYDFSISQFGDAASKAGDNLNAYRRGHEAYQSVWNVFARSRMGSDTRADRIRYADTRYFQTHDAPYNSPLKWFTYGMALLVLRTVYYFLHKWLNKSAAPSGHAH